MTVKVGILGAGGRMGAALIASVGATPELRLTGLAERAGDAAVGSKVGERLSICANASAIAHACDVLIDFTSPEALADNLEAACSGKCAILIGTTGLDAS
ncbi:MAG: 4-hydroxy-tetrahydrodipicolinate reductase, partial [Polymorphobacter sp.]